MDNLKSYLHYMMVACEIKVVVLKGRRFYVSSCGEN